MCSLSVYTYSDQPIPRGQKSEIHAEESCETLGNKAPVTCTTRLAPLSLVDTSSVMHPAGGKCVAPPDNFGTKPHIKGCGMTHKITKE